MTPTREEWRDIAACRGSEQIVFFPRPTKNTNYSAARRVCAQCTVVETCRAFFDEVEGGHPNDLHGLVAGESPHQRLARRRESPRPTRPFKLSPVWG